MSTDRYEAGDMSQINATIEATDRSPDRTLVIELLRRVLVRRYAAVCVLVALILVTDWLWLNAAGLTFTTARNTTSGASIAYSSAVFSAIGAAAMWLISCTSRYAEMANTLRFRQVSVTLGWVVLMVVASHATLVLQYLSVALHKPLVDTYLIAFDKSIGFEWFEFYRWHLKHPHLGWALGVVYRTYVPQVFLVMLVLGITNRFEDLSEFVLLFLTTVILVISIAAVFPASNPFFYFGVIDHFAASPWSFFYPLRNGTMTNLAFDDSQGLVSMPSLHALHAVLFVYAVRHVKWLLPVSVALNVIMIYSAILCGAHYLVDILAGVLLSWTAIMISRRYARTNYARLLDQKI
jgi:membrane-associated phospholipid phosphatase